MFFSSLLCIIDTFIKVHISFHYLLSHEQRNCFCYHWRLLRCYRSFRFAFINWYVKNHFFLNVMQFYRVLFIFSSCINTTEFIDEINIQLCLLTHLVLNFNVFLLSTFILHSYFYILPPFYPIVHSTTQFLQCSAMYHKHQKIPINTKKYPKIPKSTQKYVIMLLC